MSTDSDPPEPGSSTGPEPDLEDPDIDDLLDTLEDLEETVDTGAERRRVREAIRVARRVPQGAPFGRVIRGFDRDDLAQAFVGSVVFGIPMLIEGGTQEVGDFIATEGIVRVGSFPVPLFFVGTVVFGVGLVIGIVYVADFQDVRVHNPILGVVPRRLAGILGVSALTAFVLMTAWGRVDWAEPAVAAARTAVCFVGMAIGASLGDILPGN